MAGWGSRQGTRGQVRAGHLISGLNTLPADKQLEVPHAPSREATGKGLGDRADSACQSRLAGEAGATARTWQGRRGGRGGGLTHLDGRCAGNGSFGSGQVLFFPRALDLHAPRLGLVGGLPSSSSSSSSSGAPRVLPSPL